MFISVQKIQQQQNIYSTDCSLVNVHVTCIKLTVDKQKSIVKYITLQLEN